MGCSAFSPPILSTVISIPSLTVSSASNNPSICKMPTFGVFINRPPKTHTFQFSITFSFCSLRNSPGVSFPRLRTVSCSYNSGFAKTAKADSFCRTTNACPTRVWELATAKSTQTSASAWSACRVFTLKVRNNAQSTRSLQTANCTRRHQAKRCV